MIECQIKVCRIETLLLGSLSTGCTLEVLCISRNTQKFCIYREILKIQVTTEYLVRKNKLRLRCNRRAKKEIHNHKGKYMYFSHGFSAVAGLGCIELSRIYTADSVTEKRETKRGSDIYWRVIYSLTQLYTEIVILYTHKDASEP